MPFGTVISFANNQGHGSIKPEAGGVDLGFESGDISWNSGRDPPAAGERISYAVGTNIDNQPCAVNIQPI